MKDITNLKAIFGDVQALQGKLKTRIAEAEQNADKFKAAFQAAVKPENKTEIVAALKEKVNDVSSSNAQTSAGIAEQIQAALSVLRDQLQTSGASTGTAATTNATTAIAAAASTTAAAVSAATATTTTATNAVTTAATTTTTAVKAAAAAAAPPAAAPSTTIAAVNTTHPAYRVYDPGNPFAFVEPSNPGGGPNLLASDLVFNTDPRPDSLNSLKTPTGAYGSAEWTDQIKSYQAAYENLSNDNAVWNQKNMEMRNQILLASPYAAFAPSKQGTLPGIKIT